jgi:GNAT superfamily N-acetyltransferase
VIRTATPDDLALVRELWRAFEREVPEPPWRDDDSAEDLRELEEAIGAGVVLLSGDDGLVVGRKRGARVGFIDILYVRPKARGGGVAAELVRAAAEQLRAQGADTLELEVLASNDDARAVYHRWGFEPVELTLGAPLDVVVRRLSAHAAGPTFGTIHVQTDDVNEVERDVHKTLPRLGQSRQTTVSRPDNGWITVHDELCDLDPEVLHRLARELSYMNGGVVLALGVEEGALVRYTLYDRGAAVDEYASVPEFRGPLPPGDVIALGANPTVVARLTGANPARVRDVIRTASSPDELPPAVELHAQIAEIMGVQV